MLDFRPSGELTCFPTGGSQEMAPFHAAGGAAAAFSLRVISLGPRNGSGSAGSSSCAGAALANAPAGAARKRSFL